MKHVKKLIVMLVVVSMVMANLTFVFAEAKKGDIIVCNDEGARSILLPVGEPVYERSTVFSRAALFTVKITSPCDEEFRATFPNYGYEANRIIERVDDYLAREFGINFVSVAQPEWSSSSTSVNGLIYEAMNEHGLTYNGGSQADIMMAFSDGLSGYTYGVATVGYPYGVIFHSNYNQNAKSCQHEFGHTYGLGHHTTSGDCVMRQGSDTTQIDHLCPSHYNQWNGAKHKY